MGFCVRIVSVLVFTAALEPRLSTLVAQAEDCNANGVVDALDLLPGDLLLRPADPPGLMTEMEPSFLVAADLDHDGDLDLVVGTDEEISDDRILGFFEIFLNDGEGRFAPSQEYLYGDVAWGALAVDLDRDGNLDLVAGNIIGRFAGLPVLYGRGDGTFEEPRRYDAGHLTESLTAQDLDGDGDLDLATETRVLFNLGNREFDQPVGLKALGGGGIPRLVASGDLDGDGDADLAIMDSDGPLITVLVNGGDGDFSRGSELPLGVFGLPVLLRISDIDNDGDLDLVAQSHVLEQRVRSVDTLISVFRNDGDGSFSQPVERTFAGNSLSSEVKDLDGDAVPDVATAVSEHDSTLLVFSGRGDGTVAEPVSYAVRDSPVALVAGDLDGDSHPDLATVHVDRRLNFYWNNGNGTLRTEPPPDLLKGMGPGLVLSCDLHGDGDPDLVTANSGSRSVSLFFNDSRGAFLPAQIQAVEGESVSIVAADFNRDGDLDLALANRMPRSVSLLLSMGPGVFQDSVSFPIQHAPYSLAATDLDGDGAPDLAVAGLYHLLLFQNRGDGAMKPGSVIPFDAGYGPYSVVAEDLDGDGDSDLATASHTALVGAPGIVQVFLNQGAGRLSPATEYEVVTMAVRMSAADFDGDGDLDLATTSHSSGFVSLLFNEGDGIFSPAVNLRGPGPGYDLATKDLDRDGDIDLALASGGLTVHLNQGDGTFTFGGHYEVPGSCLSSLAIADFDDDGMSDLAAADRFAGLGTVFLFWNETDPPASLDINRNGIPDECDGALFRRGDSNGDGTMDLSDAVHILVYLFTGKASLECPDATDSNDDGMLDVSDAIFNLSYLFLGEDPPPAPGPAACGMDTEDDGLAHCAYDPASCSP